MSPDFINDRVSGHVTIPPSVLRACRWPEPAALLLGKTAPAYVALPALPVTKANLAEAWSQVYHKPVTDKIKKSM